MATNEKYYKVSDVQELILRLRDEYTMEMKFIQAFTMDYVSSRLNSLPVIEVKAEG